MSWLSLLEERILAIPARDEPAKPAKVALPPLAGSVRSGADGVLRGSVEALADLPDDDREAVEADPALRRGYLEAVRARRLREAGVVPDGWTATAICAGCGPVWLWPGCPSEVLACPWCFNRISGRPVPRPASSRGVLATCGNCDHFQRDRIGDGAGIGRCSINAEASRRGPSLWPGAVRTCGDFKATTTEEPRA